MTTKDKAQSSEGGPVTKKSTFVLGETIQVYLQSRVTWSLVSELMIPMVCLSRLSFLVTVSKEHEIDPSVEPEEMRSHVEKTPQAQH